MRLTALAVVVLRRTLPDAPRPYRVFGYPYVPIIFVLGSAWFLVNTLMEEPWRRVAAPSCSALVFWCIGSGSAEAAPGADSGAVSPLTPV